MMQHGKKPGMALIIGVGGPGPGKLRSPEDGGDSPMPSKGSAKQHDEPDDDQMGGPSDDDADNHVGKMASEIAAIPELAHPFSNFMQALHSYCCGGMKDHAAQGASSQNDYGEGDEY